MYERFTDRARKVMNLANQEARRFNHEYLGAEHILLGLIRMEGGVAANVFKNLEIEPRRIRLEVEKLIQPNTDPGSGQKPALTPGAKRVIESAIAEARELNHNYVGTEHLLLGLLHEPECFSARVLLSGLGLTLEGTRKEVLKIGQDRAQRQATNHGGLLDRVRSLFQQNKATPPDAPHRAHEYDIYLPSQYNDGTPVEPDKLAQIKRRLADRFGGLTFFPQRNEGTWKVGNVTFREDIVIIRVLASDATDDSRPFFQRLKEELKADLRQEEILIVARQVETL